MRRVAAFSVGLMVIVGLASAPPAVASGSPDLVISQVYGGGGLTGAPYTNDFVELFNRGASAASLTGMSLQYGSATGNIGSTAPVTLSGTLQPGQRYLVQLVAGAVTAAPLPTPDATGSTNMSNSAGKVALVNATTALLCGSTANPCTSGQLAAVVDLVGYGAANFYEGSGPTAAPNATTAAFRGSAGCNDTDDNASDFAVDIPWPRNTAAPLVSCTDSGPSVTSSTPVDGATDVAPDTDMSVTFSEAVTLDPDWFTLTCAGTPFPSSVAGGPTTFSLDPAAPLPAGAACRLVVLAAKVHDQDVIDPPDTLAADVVREFTVKAQPVVDRPTARRRN